MNIEQQKDLVTNVVKFCNCYKQAQLSLIQLQNKVNSFLTNYSYSPTCYNIINQTFKTTGTKVKLTFTYNSGYTKYYLEKI